jgi:hypothetical protein
VVKVLKKKRTFWIRDGENTVLGNAITSEKVSECPEKIIISMENIYQTLIENAYP